MASRRSGPRTPARLSGARKRTDDTAFDLLAIAARSAGEPGMPLRSWPSGDLAFLGEVLRSQNTPESLIQRLAAAAAALPPNARLIDRLTAALADQVRFGRIDEILRAPALLLLGPPGAGKTTLAAKLAARLGERRVLLVSADGERAGGLAQLEEYASVLGLPLAVAGEPAILAATLAGAVGRTLIIDTAGVGSEDDAARDHLAALIAATRAEPVLVLPADNAAEEASAMARTAMRLGTRSLLVTRLDIVRRLGGALAAADAGRLSLLAASVTPHFAYGLKSLTPEVLGRRLLVGALHDQRWQSTAA